MPIEKMKNNIQEVKKCKISLPLLITIILSSTIIFCLFVFITFVSNADNKITVTGTYSQQMKNQIAEFSLNIEENDEDKTAAVNAASEKSEQIVKALKDFGIPEEDLKTQNLNVYQREDRVVKEGATTFEKGDWYATYTITITLRNLDKSEDLTELLTSFENTSMWGPNLRLDNKKIDEGTLLAGALEDATTKANALAKKSGKKLGKITKIVEGTSSSPVFRAGVAMEGMGGAGFPIEPGVSETSKTVTVTFRLRCF